MKKKLFNIFLLFCFFIGPTGPGSGEENKFHFRKVQSVLSAMERHPKGPKELEKILWPHNSEFGKELLEQARLFSVAFNKARDGKFKPAINVLKKVKIEGPFRPHRLFYESRWRLKDLPSEQNVKKAFELSRELYQNTLNNPFTKRSAALHIQAEFSLARFRKDQGKRPEALQILENLFTKIQPSDVLDYATDLKWMLNEYFIQKRPDMISAWYVKLLKNVHKSEYWRVKQIFEAYKTGLEVEEFAEKEEVKDAEKEVSEKFSTKEPIIKRVRVNDKRELDKWVKHIKEDGPRSEEALWQVADYYEEISDFENATKYYSKIIGIDGHQFIQPALFKRGWIYYQKTEYDKAILDFHKLFVEFPNGEYYTRAAYWMAKILYKDKEESRNKKIAKSLFKKIIKDSPLSYYAIQSSFILDKDLGKLVSGHLPTLKHREPNLEPFHVKSLNRAEALLAIQMDDLAREEFDFLQYEIGKLKNKLEEGFLVYLSLIGNKTENHLGVFQILWSSTNSNPDVRTVGTLELLYPEKYFKLIKKYSGDLDPHIVMSLIRQESAFLPNARSPVGARGLMQLMPYTARSLGGKNTNNLLKPEFNIRLGVTYLKELLDQFDGNLVLALAAYNAGPHRVKSWIKRYDPKNQENFIESIPFRETRVYVKLILRNYYWYKKLKEGELVTSFNFAEKVIF